MAWFPFSTDSKPKAAGRKLGNSRHLSAEQREGGNQCKGKQVMTSKAVLALHTVGIHMF